MPTDSPDAGQSRESPQALRGRAWGAMTGAVIGLGWAIYALSTLPPVQRVVLVLAAMAVTGSLIVAAVKTMRAARMVPPAVSSAGRPRRLVWLWFTLNFVVEVILLQMAIDLLAAPALHVFWIPAISAVVGLHFLPMAMFLRVRSFWWVGGGMILGAICAAVAIIGYPGIASAVAHAEGLTNAIILWTSAGFAVLSRSSGSPRTQHIARRTPV